MKYARAVAAGILLTGAAPVHAHDIYTGVHGKNGQLCCGGSDCAPTVWRGSHGGYQFLTREGDWVDIPQDRITFLPVPGDDAEGESHRAHLCYRPARPNDQVGETRESVYGGIFLYCAFIDPGGV